MKKLAFVLALTLSASAQTQTQIQKDVGFLAADAQEGRGLGTAGLARSADYLVERLKSMGLKPARQKFPVKTGVSLGAKNNLNGVAKDDWMPLGFSSSGAFDGELVFAGYGIEAAPLNYRELEGLDLKGKVALILRYEPQEKDDKSVFDGRRPSRWSAMRYKALQARERGAAAVIFVTGPIQDEGKDKVPALVNDGPESPAGLPILQVKTSVAQKWLSSVGIDLKQFQDDVDKDLKPRSKNTGLRVKGNVDVVAQFKDAENIYGTLAGRGKLANEVIVIGAHYDHLGMGGRGSMKPNVNEIHNGADDNASGTAAVLAIADRLRNELREGDRRTVVFDLFAAEETGLGGSSWFVSHLPAPLKIENIKAMVNLDMVGQMREDKMIAFGTDSAEQWSDLVTRAATASSINLTAKGDGYGPSDQTAFYAAKVPVLHLFTGAHDRYHTPEDDASTLNYEGIDKVVTFATVVGAELARGTVSPQYARASSAPAQEGDSRGYGSYLGTVPDFSAMEATTGGVKLADVRPGSPADKAGLKGGDVIVDIAGTRIANLYDMTYALQDHKPGDTVDVVVLRNGERTTLRATLGSRSAMGAPAQGHGTPAKSSLDIKAGKPFEKTFDGERHLKDVRQLTFGGENAEAYFSPDGTKLIYQSTPERGGCDQQYIVDLTTGVSTMVSSGKGRTTCGYFAYPKGDRIIYATTEAADASCPPPPDRKRGYIWGVYDTYDLVMANADGSNPKRITNVRGYDAEATWCHKGGKFVFTSDRDGDLDLYEADENGGNVKRLTNTPGYDGGAFYNADCTEIVWRASRFEGAALDEYRALLKEHLVRPSVMELYIANADGSNAKQLTKNGAANFCPFFTPDGKRIIFASNMLDPRGREFDLFMINKDGSGTPERVTTAAAFDGFPMFSPDGQWLVFASNRSNPEGRETNLFIAKWAE